MSQVEAANPTIGVRGMGRGCPSVSRGQREPSPGAPSSWQVPTSPGEPAGRLTSQDTLQPSSPQQTGKMKPLVGWHPNHRERPHSQRALAQGGPDLSCLLLKLEKIKNLSAGSRTW